MTTEKQAEQQGHTPTPWSIFRDHPGTNTIAYIDAADKGPDRRIHSALEIAVVYQADLNSEGAANAAFIVEAVNNHVRLLAENAALRKALKRLLIRAEYGLESNPLGNPRLRANNAAIEGARLALAGGKA